MMKKRRIPMSNSNNHKSSIHFVRHELPGVIIPEDLHNHP